MIWNACGSGSVLSALNLIGHSFGAHISILYAGLRPQTTASLVRANPGPPLDREMQEMLHRAFVQGQTVEEKRRMEEIESSPSFADKDARTHEDYFKILYAAFFKDRKYLSDLRFGFTPITAQYALDAEEQLVHQLLERDPAGRLGMINCPTLVVHAEQDLIPEAFSRFIAGGIRGAEYARLSGVGHFGYLENPVLFETTPVAFLKRNAR
jgi:pimeloyl-ACP methyl ester carboxylesterase